MKTLIVLSALPGSGKSTWAKNYFSTHKNTYILSSDEVRFEVTQSYQDFSKQKKVWRIINHRLKKLMKAEDATIIVDALNDTNIDRLYYLNKFKKFDKYILVYMNKAKNEIEYFNEKREKARWVPKEDLKKLYMRFEPINEEVKKGYDEIIEIKSYRP